MPNPPLSASIMKNPVSWLYPPIEPYNTGKVKVSSTETQNNRSPVHELYFDESGNPAI